MTSLTPAELSSDPRPREPVGVVVAANSPLLGEALATRLALEQDFRPVATEGSSIAVSRLVEQLHPDAVVIDALVLSDSQYELLETLNGLRRPPVVVAIVAPEHVRLVSRLIAKGIQAAVLTTASSEELSEALRWSVRGAKWISPPMLRDVLEELAQRPVPPTHPRLSKLTKREREIIQLMVDGMSRREMAARLCVSNDTVRTHVRTILRKLEVHSSTDAVAVAREAGLRPA